MLGRRIARGLIAMAMMGVSVWTCGCGRAADQGGRPVDGVKLSKHDKDVECPSIAVGSDGVIHVAFVEQQEGPPWMYFAYYTASKDGGATWSEPKNLTEIDPDKQAGQCAMVVDKQNRVYVVWRTSLADLTGGAGFDAYTPGGYNLVYRAMDGGKWSKTVAINAPAKNMTRAKGAGEWFATVDGNGAAQVIWNTSPAEFHAELKDAHGYSNGIGPGGLIFETTMDGSAASAPKEMYMAEVGSSPKSGYGKLSHGYGVMSGYVDGHEKLHVLASRLARADEDTLKHPVFVVLEDGKEKEGFEGVGAGFETWHYPPQLLVDAKGKQHAISMYPGGEHAHVRDTVIGSNDEPTVVRAVKAGKGQVLGMEAFAGPNGKMAVLMQINETGETGAGDNYLSMSDGGEWSEAVNLTNNAARATFASKQTSTDSNMAVESDMYPGPGAVAFDKEGKPLVVLVCKERKLFGSSALGVQLVGGSSTTPTLRFLQP